MKRNVLLLIGSVAVIAVVGTFFGNDKERKSGFKRIY